MKNEVKFGKVEGISFLMVAICTQIFLNFPRVMAESVGTAGWMLVLYISIITILIFIIISILYSPFEGKDLLDIGEYAGSTIGRIITGLLIIFHFLFIISIILREFSEDLKIIALPTSPISFITIFFITGMFVGAYAGIESIVRVSVIAVPIIALGYLIILFGMFPYYDISKVMPLFGVGPKEIFIKGLSKISIFSGLIYLFIIAPFLKTKENFNKVGYLGIFISSILLIISSFIFSIVIPYPSSTEGFLPVFQMARIFYFGVFFQRLESIFIYIWVTSAMLYLSAGLYTLAYIFTKTFKLKYYKPLVLPFAILIFTISLLPPNLVSTIKLETTYFRNFGWVTTFALTLTLLIWARIIKRYGDKK